MAARGNTKQKMLFSAIELMRERGMSGVTVDAILAHSGAPRGSVYYHFPGGRSQILAESLGAAGDFMTSMVSTSAQSGPRAVLDGMIDYWRRQLERDNFGAGCPVVAAVAGGVSEAPELTEMAGEIFAHWGAAIEGALQREGVEAARAHRMATLAIAVIEGALLMCRAQRSLAPLDDVALEMAILLDGALAPAVPH